jgi:hypothetical protein
MKTICGINPFPIADSKRFHFLLAYIIMETVMAINLNISIGTDTNPLHGIEYPFS